ncbi:hypothetical protein [Microbacterium sp. YY-01]|uniref:hypothetical protein n=1 Tax=Microbacterium sp. YY-01 TaxID=3421634 RepID=UPI003D1629B2
MNHPRLALAVHRAHDAPSHRRLLAGLLAVLVAVAIVIVVPVIASENAHAQAYDAHEQASKQVEAAYGTAHAQMQLLDAAIERARDDYSFAAAMVSDAGESVIADISTRDEVIHAYELLSDAAQLQVDDSGAIVTTPAVHTSIDKPAIPPAADELKELRQQTADLRSEEEDLSSTTGATTTRTTAIEEASQALTEAVDEFMASAAAKGVTLHYAKALQETQKVHAAAAALITDDARNAKMRGKAALVKTYVDAVREASGRHKAAGTADDKKNSDGPDSVRDEPGDDMHGDAPQPQPRPNPAPDNGSRGQIVYADTACTGWGGSASASWGSNISVPSAATSVWVDFENPNSAWGVAWTCPGG